MPIADQDHGRIAMAVAARLTSSRIKRSISRVVRYSRVRTEGFTVVGAVLLGAEYQHYDVGGKSAFCNNPGCAVPTGADYDLSAKGDIVRARLTVKTQGYRFFY